MNQQKAVILEMHGIEKSFPSVKALTHIDLDIMEGEVHAIVGENGAGKSTLMKILAGVLRQDAGTIRMYDQEIEIASAEHAIKLGISCIHQELTVFHLLDVAKNIYLGNLPMKGKIIDLRKLYLDTQNVLALMELNLSPKTLCRDLSVAQQQMVEIGRAVSRNAKILIMDEPTSSLTEKEKGVLFRIIQTLKEKNVSIFYVSHKLEEVKEISDRITILHDGKKVRTVRTAEVTYTEIVEDMIGRKLENFFHKESAEFGETVLEVEGLSLAGKFSDVSFTLKSGEIVGMFGLIGAGRSEIAGAIFGTERRDRGSIRIHGKPVAVKRVSQAIKNGLCLVPEDRKQQGLVLKLDVSTNTAMLKIKKHSKFGFVSKKLEKETTEHYIQSLDIKTPSIRQTVSNLSGGNQQKVVLSKWLSMNPRILIVDEPTRGIDVGAKAEIYALLTKLARSGVAILFISSELPETMGICDRVLTVFEGRVTASIDRKDFSSSVIMNAALGMEV